MVYDFICFSFIISIYDIITLLANVNQFNTCEGPHCSMLVILGLHNVNTQTRAVGIIIFCFVFLNHIVCL